MPRSMLPTATHAAVWRNVPLLESERTAFIRIDDGYGGYDDPAAAELVEGGVTVTPFVTYYAAAPGGYPPAATDAAHIAYLRRFTTPARGVGCHAKSHAHLVGQSYTAQYDLINKGANFLSNSGAFGVRPKLFAPPYGEFDDNTLLAARAAGFTILMGWTHTPSDLAAGKPLRPGDVILLHFNATLLADLTYAADALAAADLAPGRLDDYIL